MQGQLPQMTRVNIIIVASFITIFLISAVLGQMDISLINYLGLSAGGLMKGKIWTLFTYFFVPHGLMGAIFEALIFWFIGSELESMWGEKRYIQFLSITAVGAGIIYALIAMVFFRSSQLYFYPLTGPGGVASAMCVVYGVLFPERTMYFFFFPLKAKWFVVILVAMGLYQGIFTPGGIMAWSQLAAMATGVLWMVAVTRYGLGNSSQKSSFERDRPHLGGAHRPEKSLKKKLRKKSHLSIVEEPEDYMDNDSDDDDTPPTYH